MATIEDVREIGLDLPGTSESDGQFALAVLVKGKPKGFVWSWAERVHPKKARVINDKVLAVVVPNLLAKEMILESNVEAFFTEDHYNGFPAVLVRLDKISRKDLEPLIEEAWKCKAPIGLVKSRFKDD